jgi:thiol-disulfide isomerase/thioredoxin
MRWPPVGELDLDTNARSSGAQKNWALWAALAMLAAGAVVVLYVLFAAASKPETSTGLTRFATGEMERLAVMEDAPPMPMRTLRDAAGAETTLGMFAGEIVVVNLWATWCAPCVEEMPTLAELQRRFEGRVRVVPVSVDSEGERARAQRQLAELSGNSLPFLIDITRGVLFDVRAAGMPVTIIYDRQGREVARLAGGADWSSDEAATLMEAVLAEE